MIEAINNLPEIVASEPSVFQELHNYFDRLYETVPHAEGTSQDTRTLVLTPKEATRILEAVCSKYCKKPDVNQYFKKLIDAVARSPKHLPDDKKPVIVRDSHPGPTEQICIKIPSPTDKIDGILMLFGRIRNPKNRGLFQLITDNGDWIERSDIKLQFNFPQEVEFFRLYEGLDDILKKRTEPHYTRSMQLGIFIRNLYAHVVKGDKEI
jgi:hypothetical protein